MYNYLDILAPNSAKSRVVGPAEAAQTYATLWTRFSRKAEEQLRLGQIVQRHVGLMAARHAGNAMCTARTGWRTLNTVVYQPFKVAVKEKVVIMTNVLNDIKVNLTKVVDSLEKNMMNASENANIVHMRKLLGETMDEIAEEEANVEVIIGLLTERSTEK
uniref:Uncharacterized protein n=1 Tax=Globodera rostochiensis TaxID=31243 RepID=A0A914H8K5_GLORO